MSFAIASFFLINYIIKFKHCSFSCDPPPWHQFWKWPGLCKCQVVCDTLTSSIWSIHFLFLAFIHLRLVHTDVFHTFTSISGIAIYDCFAHFMALGYFQDISFLMGSLGIWQQHNPGISLSIWKHEVISKRKCNYPYQPLPTSKSS